MYSYNKDCSDFQDFDVLKFCCKCIVNVNVYSFVKRDIRVELKRLFGRCSSHESLDFGLCQAKESAFAKAVLEIGTVTPPSYVRT